MERHTAVRKRRRDDDDSELPVRSRERAPEAASKPTVRTSKPTRHTVSRLRRLKAGESRPAHKEIQHCRPSQATRWVSQRTHQLDVHGNFLQLDRTMTFERYSHGSSQMLGDACSCASQLVSLCMQYMRHERPSWKGGAQMWPAGLAVARDRHTVSSLIRHTAGGRGSGLQVKGRTGCACASGTRLKRGKRCCQTQTCPSA